jgi:hypothetical protein
MPLDPSDRSNLSTQLTSQGVPGDLITAIEAATASAGLTIATTGTSSPTGVLSALSGSVY